MFSFRKILNIASCIILLLSLVSASGLTGISTNFERQKTELVSSKPSVKNTSVALYKTSARVYQTVIYNHYTIFNFKCLLNKQLFDFSLTLKSQKETTLQFLKHKLLEQNLIAQINTSNYKNSFIK